MPTTSATTNGPEGPQNGQPGPATQTGLARRQLVAQRLLALFVLALLLFNFPLLVLWDNALMLWGLPLFATALFVLWALLILALALVLEWGAV